MGYYLDLTPSVVHADKAQAWLDKGATSPLEARARVAYLRAIESMHPEPIRLTAEERTSLAHTAPALYLYFLMPLDEEGWCLLVPYVVRDAFRDATIASFERGEKTVTRREKRKAVARSLVRASGTATVRPLLRRRSGARWLVATPDYERCCPALDLLEWAEQAQRFQVPEGLCPRLDLATPRLAVSLRKVKRLWWKNLRKPGPPEVIQKRLRTLAQRLSTLAMAAGPDVVVQALLPELQDALRVLERSEESAQSASPRCTPCDDRASAAQG